MFIDYFVFTISIIATALFLLIHIVLSRRLKQAAVLTGLFIALVLGESFIFISAMAILYLGQLPLSAFILALFSMTFLYGLASFLYVFGIFGVIESSIRIRLLEIIEQAGTVGLSYAAILKKYNCKIIVKKRLLRLTTSGELKTENDQYALGKTFSLFLIPAYLALVMKKLYSD